MNLTRMKLYWEMDASKEVQKSIIHKTKIVLLVEVVMMLFNSFYMRLEVFTYEASKYSVEEIQYNLWNGFYRMTNFALITCIVGLVLCWILPFYGIYRHYYGSNSIYTLMRLPGSKKEFYFSKLIPTIVLSYIVYMICGMLYWIPYGMYQILVPKLYKLNISFLQVEEWLSMSVLLFYVPSVLILGIFTERSKKRPLYTILAVGMLLVSIWICGPCVASLMTKGTIGVIEFILIVFATIICIVSSIYYIERVQLV